jgi:hypothetical protein
MAVAACLLKPALCRGHQLPISQLVLVADDRSLHLELTIHAEELTFFQTLDDDRSGRLDPDELKAHGEDIAKALCRCLQIRAGKRLLQPEVAGLASGADAHHLTVRAHYSGAFDATPLRVRSELANVTRGAHATQVVFRNSHKLEKAVLEARSPQATFNLRANSGDAAVARESPGSSHAASSPSQVLSLLALAAALGGAAYFVARTTARQELP